MTTPSIAGALLLAVLLPPLAVDRKLTSEGGRSLGTLTLLCCALTLLGWVPGVIYAVIVVSGESRSRPLLSSAPADGTYAPMGLVPTRALPVA